jgi:protease-4
MQSDVEMLRTGMIGAQGAVSVVRNPANLAFADGFSLSLRGALTSNHAETRGGGLAFFAAGALAGPLGWGFGAQLIAAKDGEWRRPNSSSGAAYKFSTVLRLQADGHLRKQSRIGLGFGTDWIASSDGKRLSVIPNFSAAWRAVTVPFGAGYRAAIPVGSNSSGDDCPLTGCSPGASPSPEMEFELGMVPLTRIRYRARRYARTRVELGAGLLFRFLYDPSAALPEKTQVRFRASLSHPELPVSVHARLAQTPYWIEGGSNGSIRGIWSATLGLSFERRRFAVSAGAMLPTHGDDDGRPPVVGLIGVDWSRRPATNVGSRRGRVLDWRYTKHTIQLGLFENSDRDLKDVLDAIGSATQRSPALLFVEPLNSKFSWAQSEEIREALLAFRQVDSRNRIAFYLEGADLKGLFLAGVADRRYAHPQMEWTMNPPAQMLVYWGELLQRLGVSVAIIRTGDQKGSFETATRSAPSAEIAREIASYQSDLWNHVVRMMAGDYQVPVNVVANDFTLGVIAPELAKSKGWVDELKWPNDYRGNFMRELGLSWTRTEDTSTSQPRHAEFVVRPRVAVIYIDGFIADANSSRPMLSTHTSISAQALQDQLSQLSKDSSVRAVVLRINSPGGSVDAVRGLSAAMRQLIVSMESRSRVVASVGDSATSGGYFLASAAGYIFAPASAHVGGVGAFNAKLGLDRLFDKLGMSVYIRGIGRHSAMSSWCHTRSAEDQEVIKAELIAFQQDFVAQLRRRRKLSNEVIELVARGASFSGARALELGLVDRYGGLNDAISYASAAAGLRPGEFDLVEHEVEGLSAQPGQHSSLAWAASRLDPRLGQLVTLLTRLPGFVATCGESYYFGGTSVFVDDAGSP